MERTTAQLPVFVYGAARIGQATYDALLAGSIVSECSATLAGHKLLDSANEPYAVPCTDGEHRVVGDLVEIDPDKWLPILSTLDRTAGYRGAPNDYYVRETCTVRTADGYIVEAYVYVSRLDVSCVNRGLVVRGGDWLANSAMRGSAYEEDAW
ncbi:gamma-glutamylcyclotransferase family protein [Embleya sp. MST-111070]|uniref:gamma-glutamylcyclotransferase family protein n=1 Tax=Embleya sp. MST-111070 TaxID=3398231 RepID=UPI003F73454F